THGLELARLGPCGFVPLIGRDAWPERSRVAVDEARASHERAATIFVILTTATILVCANRHSPPERARGDRARDPRSLRRRGDAPPRIRWIVVLREGINLR